MTPDALETALRERLGERALDIGLRSGHYYDYGLYDYGYYYYCYGICTESPYLAPQNNTSSAIRQAPSGKS